MNRFTIMTVAIIATWAASAAQAADPAQVPANSQALNSFSGSLSPQQRGAAISKFVNTWGPYVEQTYGVDVHTWAQRMVPSFAQGDATNIQKALTRTTFEGAMAALDGAGHRLSDDQVITSLAVTSMKRTQSNIAVTPEALGELDKDLVFTPITPCRIADTRLAGGPITGNTSRSFGAWGYSSYATWGGSATNCGLLNEHPTSILVNVTAVTPAIAGYATAYSGALASPPFVATINYAGGDVVNGSAVVGINPASSPDYKIYSFANSNYVVDVVGFYDSPHATPLECTTLTGTAVNVPANSYTSATAPACTTGYTQVSLNCDTNNYLLSLSGQSRSSRSCYYNNTDATAHTGTASVDCCRVPGR